ncbi:MAG: mandelate racemase/muconate lactonizing enzyme family protein [Thermoplasmata archaeon]
MKITDVTCEKVSIPLRKPKAIATRPIHCRQLTVVQVSTDEDLTGVGWSWSHAVATIVEETLKDLLVGEDPFQTEWLWSRMYGAEGTLTYGRRGAAIRAISAVDVALWDLKGKALEMPVCRLLGGCRSRVPVYASGGYYEEGKTVDDLADETVAYVKQGFKAVKIKVGLLSLDEDEERVRAVREAVGPDVGLMVDANNAYRPYSAIRAARTFEKYGVEWFEEPVSPDDLCGSARVAAAIDTPVASGELEYTRYGFRALIDKRAVDIVQPDANVAGGVTEWIKIAALASANSTPVAPHSSQEVHVHLVAATPGAFNVEFFDPSADIRKTEELFTTHLTPRDGYLAVPRKPGFGIELSQKAVERYRVR